MTQDNLAAPVSADSPFQPSGRRRLGRLAALLAFVLVLIAAVVAVRLLGRRGEPAAALGGHDHAAAPAGDSAMPVMLSEAQARRIGVTYAPVRLGPLGRVVRTVAIVSYDETRLKSVTARVDGWVERLYLDFTGQSVRIGDPLFSLYSPMLVSAQQELLLAKRLRASVAGGSPDAVRGAEDLLESARRRLLYWEVPASDVAEIEASGEIRKALTFRSPVEGVVIEKTVLGGQRIMAGETVFKIADLSTVWLEGEIFERDLPLVRLGLQVVAEFPALPAAPRSGRITYVYPTLNLETRTARVRVELANPRLALKPGMYATLHFAAATGSVLSVPRSAILSTGKRDLVFVRFADGSLVARDVTLGVATDDRVEILSGLAVLDTVVASATFLVDAESNLSTLLGGMGNMPGMDISPPAPPPGSKAPEAPGLRAPPKDTTRMKMPEDEHAAHRVPERE
ncbi:MAG: efflux RND transporter periplasmic adaptor subunit [Gemmatimonadales bacterium]|nr:efflux RND transporter periplasmic adaptor subunit [Gemmatimonadales bacterium]